jgi:pimeloyl-ACP methyl ester carboxylesterase
MLFCYTSGEPRDPAIVFLHGAGLSGRMWQFIREDTRYSRSL